MKFLNKISGIIKTLVLAAAITTIGCTKVDYDLGYNFIPEHQKMTLHLDTLSGINTFAYYYDSITSCNLNYMFIGQKSSSVYGRLSNSCLLQFLPIAIPYEGGFGLDPIIDSMYITMPISSWDGDTTKVQTFNVYELNTDADLHYNSLYYTNTDPLQYYSTSNLLFTFKYSGRSNLGARMYPTSLGKQYMQGLVDLDTTTYKSDTLFRKKYKGLYIAPAEASPKDAASYQFNLESAYMKLYVRDHDSTDQAKIKDTLTAWYYFYDSSDYENLSVNMAKYDYAGSTLGTLQAATNNFTDATTVLPTVYVQGWGGVLSKLKFTDQLVDQLNALHRKVENGTTVESSMFINQAMIYLEMADYDPSNMATVDYMNAAPKRLGSYLTMRSSSSEGYAPSRPIRDYPYDIEKSYQQSDETYMLPYNGYLSRSNGYYVLDVTSYIQQIMKGELRRTIIIGPSAYDFFGYGQVALKGETTQPIKLSITYTPIRPYGQTK